MKGEGNRHFDRLDLGAPNDVRKSASLLSFKLKVGCPFLGDSSGLFVNGACRAFHAARKWQSQKFENAFRGSAARRHNLFIKKTPS